MSVALIAATRPHELLTTDVFGFYSTDIRDQFLIQQFCCYRRHNDT